MLFMLKYLLFVASSINASNLCCNAAFLVGTCAPGSSLDGLLFKAAERRASNDYKPKKHYLINFETETAVFVILN